MRCEKCQWTIGRETDGPETKCQDCGRIVCSECLGDEAMDLCSSCARFREIERSEEHGLIEPDEYGMTRVSMMDAYQQSLFDQADYEADGRSISNPGWMED